MSNRRQQKQRFEKLASVVDKSTTRRLRRLMLGARLMMVAETLWPGLMIIGLATGLWFAGAWLGADRWLAVHLALLGLIVALGLYGIWQFRKVSWPTQAQIVRRLEQDNQLLHRPLTHLLDRESFGGLDETSFRMWQASRQQSAGRLRQHLHRISPAVLTQRIDPYALRAPVILLVVIGFMAASGDRLDRLSGFLSPNFTAEAGRIVRVDGWINPPSYTRKPPVSLPVETVDGKLVSSIEVPIGSELQFRVSGAEFILRVDGQGIDPQVAEDGPLGAPVSYLATLASAGEILLEGDAREWRYGVSVIADQPPEIFVNGLPEVAQTGSLTFRYAAQDDYGLKRAWSAVTPADPALTAGTPLIEPPEINLRLPSRLAEDGEAQTVKNLTEHPWAGARVSMQYFASDAIDQTGQSEPFEMVLPQRQFFKPLARAIVEQRRRLALDKHARRKVQQSLDALMVAPESFIPDLGHYLGIRSAYRRLVLARDDDQLRALLPQLWDLALAIEDGSLSDAERRLRTAQERLMDALENNAGDEEIARLIDELREALQEFAEMLAQRAQENPQSLTQQEMDELRALEQQDINDLLAQIEELSRQGAKEAARQLLEQLQQSLENLRSAMRREQGQDPMAEQLNQLGEMIRRQQELQNQTQQEQRRQQQQRQQGQQGQQGERQQGERGEQGERQQGEQGEQGMSAEELAQRQQELADQLRELMEQMQQQGMEPGEQFGEAEGAMGDATSDLEGGRPGEATNDQGRAIDALRQGAQELAQQMQENRQGPGNSPNARQLSSRPDPLGRRSRPDNRLNDERTKVPDQMDTERAREILDTIRRRLGDIDRPAEEKEYLERLIDRF